MDLNWTEKNREQLWAEAAVAYKNGEKWYLEQESQEVLDTQSSDFRQFDPWHEVIERFISGNGLNCSTTEIMEQGLRLEKYQMTRSSEMRVGDIMRQLGYERVRRRIYGDRKYVWVQNKKDNVIEIDKPKAVVENVDVEF